MKIRYFLWLQAIGLLYVYLNLFRDVLIDDAFITLTYVKTILSSGTWGFYPGYIANTATSPLNVLFLCVISIFSGPTINAAILSALFGMVLIAFFLVRISKLLFESEIFGYMASIAFIFNPLLISTIGLESILFSALLVVSVYCYLAKKWSWLAFVLGLLTLTRTDGVLFFLVFLIFIPTSNMKIKSLIIYIISIAPWYIFSWLYLGSVVPDTFFIKMAAGSWKQYGYFNGILLYFRNYPFETVLSLSFLPLALGYFHKRVRKLPVFSILFFLGVIHFVAYSIIHVPPFHWYYIPELTLIILFGMLSFGSVCQCFPMDTWQKKMLDAILVFCFFIPAVGMMQILRMQDVPYEEMPIQTNCATHKQYKEVGLWLKENLSGEPIHLSGEIGTLSYYCDCYLLDEFSYRKWTKDFIGEYTSRWELDPYLYKMNFIFYSDAPYVSPGKFELILGDQQENYENEWEVSTKWCRQHTLSLVEVSD